MALLHVLDKGFLLALPSLGRAQRVPEPARGAASTHKAPRGSGALGGDEGSRAGCQGSSTAGMEDAGRVRKAAVPDSVPIPQWGLFWSLWAGCGPAGSVPDSHPRRLGGSWWRATSPAHLPTGLGHGMGAGGNPLRMWDPVPSCSLPNSPAENPRHRAGPCGTGARFLPKAGRSLPPELAFPGEELQQSEAFALSDHIYLNILRVCVSVLKLHVCVCVAVIGA